MESIDLPILVLSLILLGSILSSLVSFRIGIPMILLFLCFGIAIGDSGLELINGLKTPRLIFSLGAIALALILFDAGYQTSKKSYRQSGIESILLATAGVFITAVFLTPCVMYITGFSPALSFLLSSIISSTDSASVFFLLRTQGIEIKDRIKSTLEIESGGNDPMAICLTFSGILLLNTINVNPLALQTTLLDFLKNQFGYGIFFGLMTGYMLKYLINRLKLELSLSPLFVLAVALLAFSMTNIFGGSGFLALYIAGYLLGNHRHWCQSSILKFQQTLSWLSQITLFTSLGLFVHLNTLWQEFFNALCIFILLSFCVRPLMVYGILGWFSGYTFLDKLFISLVGLRGASSILLALSCLVYAVPNAHSIFNLIFLIVLISLTFQGFSLSYLARKCRVRLQRRKISGASVQIELPGLKSSHLKLYHVEENSGLVKGLSLPTWVHPVLIIRSGISYLPGKIKHFKSGDEVYIFVPSDKKSEEVDAYFSDNPELKHYNILGDFPLSCTTTFHDLHVLYGLKVPPQLQRKKVATFIEEEFDTIQIGDRLSLEELEIIVRDIQDGKITALGVDIDPQIGAYLHKIYPFKRKKLSQIPIDENK